MMAPSLPPLDGASPHLLAHRSLLEEAVRLGPVADLACGRGRNAVEVGQWGLPVVGVDRNPDFLAELKSRTGGLRVRSVRADLESSAPLPLAAGCCGAVLVFRFLYRPLAPRLETLLAPGGVLLYETFTLAQADRPGGPNNPAFLLGPGELAGLFPGLETLSCEEDATSGLARLAARRPR